MSLDIIFCPNCNDVMEKVWFIEEEYRNGTLTGRARRAVSHLECPRCFHKECVDDTFDEPWYKERN